MDRPESREISAGSVQLASSGPTETGTFRIGARRTEWKRNQAADEVEAAKRIANLSGRAWATFDKVDGSDVDVVARSADRGRKERYRVTVLYDGPCWASLNAMGAAEIELTPDDAVHLIRYAVERKRNRYPATQRPEFILLVDLVPGGMATGFALHARQVLRDLLAEAAFKEVWLVGATSDHLFQLSP